MGYPCRITTYGDYAECDKCGLAWGTNDADPPACRFDRAGAYAAAAIGLAIAFVAVPLIAVIVLITLDIVGRL